MNRLKNYYRTRFAAAGMLIITGVMVFLVCAFQGHVTFASNVVSGYIKPDFTCTDASINSGFKVEIEGCGYALTDKQGYFIINGSIPSLCTLKISKESYLSRKIENVTADTVIGSPDDPIYIWPGDIPKNGIQDNAINMLDIQEVAKGFNSTSGDLMYNMNMDFNLDNVINISDIMIICKHFNASTESYADMMSADLKKFDLEEIKTFSYGDITPKNVFIETGCQIFKSSSYESYLMYEGNKYNLGASFGGFGIADIKTSDFDGNGIKELLYTYSWGSGIHRSCFGYFDLSKKCESKIDISEANSLGFIQEELIYYKISDKEFEVYRASISVDPDRKISLSKVVPLGKIIAVDGKPKLVLSDPKTY